MGSNTIDETQFEDGCNAETAQFFIQYKCLQDPSLQEAKYKIKCFAVCMVAFVAYLFKRVIQFLESTSKLDMLAQDAATITAGDFTCEMDITPKMWRYYLDVIYEEQVVKTGLQEESGELYSPALYLKKHLNQEIKRILTASLKYRTEKEKAESKGPIHHKEKHLPGNREKPTEVECKGIQFAYNNY